MIEKSITYFVLSIKVLNKTLVHSTKYLVQFFKSKHTPSPSQEGNSCQRIFIVPSAKYLIQSLPLAALCTLFPIAIGIVLSLVLCTSLHSQTSKSVASNSKPATDPPKQIELKHADVLEYDETQGIRAQRLIGNVAFFHDGADMFCDSAYLFKETNSLNAYGHVKIINSSTGEIITGDSLHYLGNEKQADLRGKVKLEEKERELYTTMLDYNMKENIVFYSTGGKLINKKEKSQLTSTYGYYYTKKKEFFFKEKVVLVHPDYTIKSDTMMHNTATNITYFLGPTEIKDSSSFIYCKYGWFDQSKNFSKLKGDAYIINKNQKLSGDSIYYDKGNKTGEAFSNVSMIDTLEDIVISGEYGFYNEEDSTFFVTGQALFTEFSPDDTLYLHGDTLYSTYDTTKKSRIIKAYDHVKFFRRDLQGACDSLTFVNKDSLIKMYYDPIIWSDSSQLSANYIEIKQADGKIDSMLFKDNAFIISIMDSLKYNQINGKTMRGYFEKNKLVRIYVYEEVKTIYFADDNKKIIGMNVANSENMIVSVKDNEIDKIKFIKPEKSTLYPIKDITKANSFLNGFSWRIKNKPSKKEDVFQWNKETTF